LNILSAVKFFCSSRIGHASRTSFDTAILLLASRVNTFDFFPSAFSSLISLSFSTFSLSFFVSSSLQSFSQACTMLSTRLPPWLCVMMVSLGGLSSSASTRFSVSVSFSFSFSPSAIFSPLLSAVVISGSFCEQLNQCF